MKIKSQLSLGFLVGAMAVHSFILSPSGFAADKLIPLQSNAAGKTFQPFQVAQKSESLSCRTLKCLLKNRKDMVNQIKDLEAKLKRVDEKLQKPGRQNSKRLLKNQKNLTRQVKLKLETRSTADLL